jgi:outer membrane lipoprotein SlyB
MTGESPGVGGAGVTGVTGVTEGFGTPSSVADVSGAQAPY